MTGNDLSNYNYSKCIILWNGSFWRCRLDDAWIRQRLGLTAAMFYRSWLHGVRGAGYWLQERTHDCQVTGTQILGGALYSLPQVSHRDSEASSSTVCRRQRAPCEGSTMWRIVLVSLYAGDGEHRTVSSCWSASRTESMMEKIGRCDLSPKDWSLSVLF